MTGKVSPKIQKDQNIQEDQNNTNQSTVAQTARLVYRGAIALHNPSETAMRAVVNVAFGGARAARKEMDELVFEDMKSKRGNTYPSEEFFHKKIEDALTRIEKNDPDKHKKVSQEYANYLDSQNSTSGSNESHGNSDSHCTVM